MAIDEGPAQLRTRRAILVGAIGGLAGLVGSRLAWPDEAEAAAGGKLVMGHANSAGTKNTSLSTTTNSGQALKVTQKGTGTALRGTAAKGVGVSGVTADPAKFGVDAANNAVPTGAGAAIRASGGNNAAMLATSTVIAIDATTSGSNYAVRGTGAYAGLRGQGGPYGSIASGSSIGSYGSAGDYGVYGAGGVSGVFGGGETYGVYGSAATGVFGSGSTYGVVGTTTNPNTPAVRGDGGQYGVQGINGRTAGIRGDSGYVGAWGQAGSFGVYGLATGAGQTYGVFGQSTTSAGFGVYCSGNMHVNGTLTKTAGSFKIDHPLHPEDRWLSHSFVESPDMMNVYNGIAVLDGKGAATIEMPDYFAALNRDVRYQLTAIGAASPSLHVSREMKKNAFGIAGGTPGQKVSWQVTGIRQDDYAKAHPIVVETAKKGSERGARQFVPDGSTARLMQVRPDGVNDPLTATPTVVPKKVKPRDL